MTVYSSQSVHTLAAAERRRLRLHQPDPRDGRCARCARPAPCDEARGSVDFLVERHLPLVDDSDERRSPLGRYRKRRRSANAPARRATRCLTPRAA
jgi:hypothetical protein